ncbi:lipoprotein [Spiroplasma melliferum]|uniref:Lipoprotein n=2 Tax=Spiroplasma melliferum TaxID=2134 RepID=A0AAI9T3E6_SPIME|nr:lipoprotein [Spiroplasma melliferum]KAI92758.1 hypothetical protein SPM_001705 [Spiroplasma melliferum KC3]QCO24382.1 hypothetical protein SRED_002878 [Spiroplasma melliferum]
MKKLLSILGAIGLTATSTTSLISCEKPNNNENGGGNKPEPKPEPQQPPENSNWKVVNNSKEKLEKEFNSKNNNWYIFIAKRGKYYSILQGKNDGINIKYDSLGNIKVGFETIGSENTNIYRWDGLNEPQTPEIDTNTGKITDWKE